MERYRVLRPLGTRPAGPRAALEIRDDGRSHLVVVERATGDVNDPPIADWVRDAKRLATLEHPNVARVRDVLVRGNEIWVVSDFVDGVKWTELWASTPRPPLDVALRVLVDVLTGLAAIHNLRDAKRAPLKLVHGAVTPDCVVVGIDGVSRVVGAARPRSRVVRHQGSETAYLAPEVLLADSADARSDTYGIGAMLWTVLSGRPPFDDIGAPAIVTQLLSGRVPRAAVPEGSPWAAPLVELAQRAMCPDPEKRFATAAAMTAELRRIAGTKLAAAARKAAFVREAFGEGIDARRRELERGDRCTSDISRVEDARDSIPIEAEDPHPSRALTPVPRVPASEGADFDTAPTKPPPPTDGALPPLRLGAPPVPHFDPDPVTELLPEPLPKPVTEPLAEPLPKPAAPIADVVVQGHGALALPTGSVELSSSFAPIVAPPAAPPATHSGRARVLRSRRRRIVAACAVALGFAAIGALAWHVGGAKPPPIARPPAMLANQGPPPNGNTTPNANVTQAPEPAPTSDEAPIATATRPTSATPTLTPNRVANPTTTRAPPPSPPFVASPPRGSRGFAGRKYQPEGI